MLPIQTHSAAKVGSTSLQLKKYDFQIWVPPHRTDKTYTPGHWIGDSLKYVQVNMPPQGSAPMMMTQQPVLVPGEAAQPGTVQLNPMVIMPQ
jgi:hypothetical protein